jgi:hypothetical protein
MVSDLRYSHGGAEENNIRRYVTVCGMAGIRTGSVKNTRHKFYRLSPLAGLFCSAWPYTPSAALSSIFPQK